MSNVRRIYVEKKEPYAVKAKELHDELKNYLGIDVAKVREFIRYDVENISDEVFARACRFQRDRHGEAGYSDHGV